MKSAILLSSVAAVALASPALALPDRFDQAGCGGTVGAQRTDCLHHEVIQDVGHQHLGNASLTSPGAVGTGGAITAARVDNGDNDTFGGEIGDTASDVAQDTGEAAQDVGAAAVHAANEAGDTLGEAANDVGDTISNAAGDVADAF